MFSGRDIHWEDMAKMDSDDIQPAGDDMQAVGVYFVDSGLVGELIRSSIAKICDISVSEWGYISDRRSSVY